MNFYELPDKDFDEKFRKAAESAGYPFNEEAWTGMEKKLDQWEKFGPAFWKLSGGLIFILLGLMVFLILKTPETGESETLSSQIAGNELNESISGNGSGIRGNNEIEKLPQVHGDMDNLSLAEKGQNQTVSAGKSPDSEWIEGKKNNPGISGPGTKVQVAETENSPTGLSRESITMADAGNSTTVARNEINSPVTLIPGRVGLQGITGAPELKKPLTEIAESVVIPVIPAERNKISLGYSLNLMIGPDFSGVGAESYGAGTFAGLGLEIYIGNRLSLMTGISHARKKYAVSDEYTMPYGGGQPYGQDPVSIDIACQVLDIPVNVYYSIFRNRQNRFFAGAGFSTYLMLTEEYHLKYDDYYGQDPVRDYTVKNENQHYFGIINLSAGYTRELSTRWALQVEPYLKLPIQDIAAAEVRLNSFGALIALKYRFR